MKKYLQFLFLTLLITSCTSQPSTTTSSKTTPEIAKNYLGEKIIIGNFAYTINSYYTTTEIGEYWMDNFVGVRADGIFIIMDVTIENIGMESITLLGNNLKIIDDLGRRFNHDAQAELYLGPNQQFTFEQMQPGLPKTGKVVFDVPQDIQGLLEITTDKPFSNQKKIRNTCRKTAQASPIHRRNPRRRQNRK